MLIPNRLAHPLDPVEQMAEGGGDLAQLADAAQATGNWSLFRLLLALRYEAKTKHREQRKKGPAPPPVALA